MLQNDYSQIARVLNISRKEAKSKDLKDFIDGIINSLAFAFQRNNIYFNKDKFIELSTINNDILINTDLVDQISKMLKNKI